MEGQLKHNTLAFSHVHTTAEAKLESPLAVLVKQCAETNAARRRKRCNVDAAKPQETVLDSVPEPSPIAVVDDTVYTTGSSMLFLDPPSFAKAPAVDAIPRVPAALKPKTIWSYFIPNLF